jgi:hypothetical protein
MSTQLASLLQQNHPEFIIASIIGKLLQPNGGGETGGAWIDRKASFSRE